MAAFKSTQIEQVIHGQASDGSISIDSKGNFATQDTLVLDTFIIATIRTLRGVLMKNLKGTPLGFITIPLIPIEHFRKANQK